ncbi:hypothetical protein H6P81_002529 [Aristolochia fimbriata]|uniref:Uncharacterized protein n=1 Tax=Aristolochia fimbriata TaxID=158543 RepID=A0AAV7FD79_ARIFI|nr:hypothetical protein H6P81_002529 [Aristolochia fimbriata]
MYLRELIGARRGKSFFVQSGSGEKPDPKLRLSSCVLYVSESFSEENENRAEEKSGGAGENRGMKCGVFVMKSEKRFPGPKARHRNRSTATASFFQIQIVGPVRPFGIRAKRPNTDGPDQNIKSFSPTIVTNSE